MTNTNKIILAVIIIIIITIISIYGYMQIRYIPGYAPYSSPTPTPSESPSVTNTLTPTLTPTSIPATPTPSPTQIPKTSPTPSLKPSPSISPKPSASPTPTPTPKLDTFNISAVEFSYSPNSITVKSGDMVKINFTNNGAYSHNLTMQGLNIATQTLNPGQTATIQFAAPLAGNYTFFCSVDSHKSLGLIGTMKVE